MLLGIFAVLLLLAALPAQAEFRINASGLQLYVPQLPWALAMPREDWQILEEKRNRDGTSVYYFIASPTKGLQFSVYLDRSAECGTGPTCRELWKKNSGKAFADAREPSELERNGFSVLQFHLDKPMGTPVVQANASAHMYRDGYWIDVRISRVGPTKPEAESLLKVLDAMAIRPKSLEGPRQYPAGRGRYIAMDIPAEWRDSPARGTPGTVEMAPPTGDGFKVMMSVIPAKDADSAPPTRESLLEMAKRAVESVQAQSVEPNIEPREFRGRSAWGYRFSGTDRNPAPGEYRYMTQGVMAISNLTVTFTILSRDGEEKSVTRAMDAMAGARMAP